MHLRYPILKLLLDQHSTFYMLTMKTFLELVVILFLLYHPSISQNEQFDIFDAIVPPTTDPLDGIFPDVTENHGITSEATPDNRKPDIEENDEEEECECIPYYLCDSRYTVSRRKNYGEGVINIRLGKNKECPHYILKCCDDEDTAELEEEIEAEKNGKTTPPPTTTTPKPTEPSIPKACGYRTAEFGEFPWVVAIYNEGPNRQINYLCGGALIHPEVVLTAAHCLSSLNKQTKTRVGSNNNQQKREVSGATIHHQFNKNSLVNDIALIYLKKPVDLTHINVVCLPPQNTVIDNTRCVANGWDKNSFGKSGSVVKEIDLPIVATERCETDLQKIKRGYTLHPSFVCAGGEEEKDTCRGDGGNPLTCRIPSDSERYFQIGIVAGGIGCGRRRAPGLYTNVALFRNWIDEKLKSKNIDISVYNA